jgi:hypothetical protein
MIKIQQHFIPGGPLPSKKGNGGSNANLLFLIFFIAAVAGGFIYLSRKNSTEVTSKPPVAKSDKGIIPGNQKNLSKNG